MNEDWKTIHALVDELGPVEALKRLEGTPPAGSLPASGSGAAEREPSQPRDTCSSSAPPFGGQATGELQRLLEYLENEAENMEALGTPVEGEDPCIRESAERYAADYRLWASLVRDAIGEPRAQSGADGDELETAVEWFRGIAHREVVRLEELAEKQWREGADKLGAMYDRLTTKSKRFQEVLETLLSQESRKERSGPPNDQS